MDGLREPLLFFETELVLDLGRLDPILVSLELVNSFVLVSVISRGEPKDGKRSKPDRFPKWLFQRTGKENGIIAQIYDF